MHTRPPLPRWVVIFADESADWRVAGLRQLDRLYLALHDAGLAEVQTLVVREPAAFSSLGEGSVLVLSTRLVPGRDFARSYGKFLCDAAELRAQPSTFRRKIESGGNSYLFTRADLPRATRALFQQTAKTQDGVVSRLINRPLSRGLSRLLVRTPLTPNRVTLLLMLLPLAGACWLLRGDYFGFALGAILFQLHSALDGCDGEIARVKYLESEAGARLDQLCDRFSTLLFAIALGAGLSRQTGSWIYLVEGLAAALFLGVAETYLTRQKIEDQPYGSYLTDHRDTFNQGDQMKLWLMKGTGLFSLGNGVAAIFSQLTKRDVFNFVFMLLALCGLASSVLHILALSACAILVVGLKEFLAPALNAKTAA